jgi:hypothetical protein
MLESSNSTINSGNMSQASSGSQPFAQIQQFNQDTGNGPICCKIAGSSPGQVSASTDPTNVPITDDTDVATTEDDEEIEEDNDDNSNRNDDNNDDDNDGDSGRSIMNDVEDAIRDSGIDFRFD